MTKLSRLFLLVSLAWLLDFGTPLRAGGCETAVLENANAALNKIPAMRGNWIMMALLPKAQAVAIFPRSIKVAVGIGGRHGRGVLLIRGADGSWGPPEFLTLSGASAGIQAGVERADLVIILRTRNDLECLKKGKLTLGLGDILAVGPFGRDKILSTDVGLKTVVISGSPCKGLFAGWCVVGARLRLDAAATAAYEQSQQNCMRNAGPMGAGVPSPSLQLQMKLAELSAALPTHNMVRPSRCDPPVSPQP